MTQRQEIIERLDGLEMEGGSHEMLSAICKAVLPHQDAWTLRRCADLRDRLVRLLGDADTPTSDGHITDELREWAHGFTEPYKRNEQQLLAIADRIDAEHERAIKSVMNDALYHANDKDMADLGWVRLSKDADGEYIHAGEKLDGYGKTITVVEMRYGRSGWVLISECGNAYADSFAFTCHHAPTVEKVLYEFICDHEEGIGDEVDLIAEYAKRLKLAGDAE